MSAIALKGLPDDFQAVGISLPYRTGDVLGYIRGERFVGFYWDRELGPMWDDGLPVAADRTVWISFITVAARLEQAYGVRIGNSTSTATHMLIWDRRDQEGYIAPMESAKKFLREKMPQVL